MLRGVPPDLFESLQRERLLRHALQNSFDQIVHSRLYSPLRLLWRLTKRGPDLDQMRDLLSAPPEPEWDNLDQGEWITDSFHRLYFDRAASTWFNTNWLGTRVLKCPLDLWLYQELIHSVRPDFIIEAGTYYGGSALYIATLMDLIGHGEVLTIDIDPLPDRPAHPRVTYCNGSSVDPDLVESLRTRVAGSQVIVILDSDHTAEHVLQELHCFADVVPVGSYLIVEDTCIHGHPVRADLPAGPAEAIEEFMRDNHDYIVDPIGDKFLLTFNPGGILKRVR